MASNHLKNVLLEVERKFARLRVHPLTSNGGTPAFEQLEYLGARRFHDVYFDYQQALSRSGTWLRKRNGQWESKIRQAGDYNNSQFREVHDLDEITNHIHAITGNAQPHSEAFGLSKIAEMTTHREAWRADRRFKIVLDRMDFDHTVGEVELEASVTVRSESEAREICTRMDLEVAGFMQRYQWAFDPSPAVGKLTAYFARQKKQ